MNGALEWARSTIRDRELSALSDAELLSHFLESREEASFAAIVKRHGPLVLGVCKRFLRNHHDAEDAFQAVFLVLMKRADSIKPRAQLASWLYGVAYKTAYKTRQYLGKHRVRERAAIRLFGRPDASDGQWDDFWFILDQELNRLPSKYRDPIILCDLDGRSRREAAHVLGILDGTLSGRLTRGRRQLAARLTRRGVSLSGAVMAALLVNESARAAMPPGLAATTVRGALAFSCKGTLFSSSGAVAIPSITRGVIHSMFMTKLWQAASVLFVAAALVGAGGTVLAYRGSGSDSATEQLEIVDNGAESTPQDSKANSQKLTNRQGENQPNAQLKRSIHQQAFEAKTREWETRWKEYQAGRGVLDFLTCLSHELAQYELVLANGRDERLDALKAEFMRAFDIWEITQSRYIAGKVGGQDMTQARGYYESVRDRKRDAQWHDIDAPPSEQIAVRMRELNLSLQLVDVATHCWNARKLEFEAGHASQAQALLSARQLRDAHLRTRLSNAERHATLNAHLDRIRGIERIAQRRSKAGQIADAELDEARYARIEAELDLEQVPQK
jgi:RNA polymerase sigma factor (sigma-70 family)